MFRLLKRSAIPAVGLLALAVATPAFASSDNCLNVNGITSRSTSAIVSAAFTYTTDASSGNTTFTYTFSGLDPITPSSGGIPGLITYCVYPVNGFLPNAIAVDAGALGADGEPFVAEIAAKGSFSYTRAHGDPSNIAFDGNTYTMGTATWNGSCTYDQFNMVNVCTPPATDNPTIHLHINDPGECQSLYGGTDTTCWVYPTRVTPPPSTACNGNVACKSADIAEATGDFDASGYPIVPMFTQLHIKYTYLIVNQPGSGVTMSFNPPTSKTQDINSGGGKDYFGCEQSPDQTTGTPGSFSPPSFTNYAGPGFTLNFTAGTGTCNQSRFTLVASSTITLNPGDSRTFTIDMVTRQNKSKNYEYTSAGPHLLNSGFTVKWFQSGPSPACPAWKSTTTLCSYTTGVTPLYVDAQPSLSP